MAKIIGGIGSSHVPTVGVAYDKGRQDAPAWARLFEVADEGAGKRPLGKFARLVGKTNLKVYASMRGETSDDFMLTRPVPDARLRPILQRSCVMPGLDPGIHGVPHMLASPVWHAFETEQVRRHQPNCVDVRIKSWHDGG